MLSSSISGQNFAAPLAVTRAPTSMLGTHSGITGDNRLSASDACSSRPPGGRDRSAVSRLPAQSCARLRAVPQAVWRHAVPHLSSLAQVLGVRIAEDRCAACVADAVIVAAAEIA